MIDTGAVKACSDPMPYMILRTNSMADANLAVESNGLVLSAKMIDCSFVDSKPTGVTNLGVAESFLRKFSSERPKKTASEKKLGDKDGAASKQ